MTGRPVYPFWRQFVADGVLIRVELGNQYWPGRLLLWPSYTVLFLHHCWLR